MRRLFWLDVEITGRITIYSIVPKILRPEAALKRTSGDNLCPSISCEQAKCWKLKEP